MGKIARLNWSKRAKQFSVNSRGKLRCQYQTSRRAGKQALGLQFSFLRILDTFQPFRFLFLEKYNVLLGKYLMDSEQQVILIFTEV